MGFDIRTLTDGLDTIEGTANDDTINGFVDAASNNTTWQPQDTVNGAGGDDTFELRALDSDGDNDINTAGRDVQNVENLEVRARVVDGGNDNTISVATDDFDDSLSSIDVTQLRGEEGNQHNLSLTALETGEDVTISGSSEEMDVQLNYAAGELDGSSDTAKVYMNGGTTRDLQVNGEAETVAIETANAAATVANNVDTATDGNDDLQTLQVSGDQDLTVNGDANGFAASGDLAIDASNLSGDLTMGAAVNDRFTVTGGSGDDQLNANLGGTSLSSDFTASNLESLVAYNLNGGESVDMTNAGDVTTIGMMDGGTGGGGDGFENITFNAVSDNSTAVLQTTQEEGEGNNSLNTANLTVNHANADTGNPANSLSVSISNQGVDPDGAQNEATLAAGNIVSEDVADISVDVADADGDINEINAASLESLSFAANEDVTVSGSALGNDGDGNETATDLGTINASNVDGSFDVSLSGSLADNTNTTVTSGAGDDDITVFPQTANNAQTLSVSTGDGGDTLTLQGDGAGGDDDDADQTTQEIDAGSGDDTIQLANNAAFDDNVTHTITGGDGSDELIVGDGNAHNITNAELSNIDKITLVDTGGAANKVQIGNNLSGDAIDLSIFDGQLEVNGGFDAGSFSVTGSQGLMFADGGGASQVASPGDDHFVLDDFSGADDITDFNSKGDDELVIDVVAGGNQPGGGGVLDAFTQSDGVVDTAAATSSLKTGASLSIAAGVTTAITAGTGNLADEDVIHASSNQTGASGARSALSGVLTKLLTVTANNLQTSSVNFDTANNSLTLTASGTQTSNAKISSLASGQQALALVQTGNSDLFAFTIEGFAAASAGGGSNATSTTVAFDSQSIASLDASLTGSADVFLA